MKGWYLRSAGFKSIRKCPVVHSSLLNDVHVVAKDPLKLNYPINIF